VTKRVNQDALSVPGSVRFVDSHEFYHPNFNDDGEEDPS